MSTEKDKPRHVAIIMDGNGRWAQAHGLERVEGHVKGVESVRRAIKSTTRHGVRWLTLYVFSTENWGRPAAEVDALMELMCRCVADETPALVEQGARIRIIGRRWNLPEKVRLDMERIERDTAAGETITVTLALSYSSRSEIVDAVRLIAQRAAAGELGTDEIDERMVSDNLYTAGCPDPDLIVRTGGDQRLSNFLLWQGAYAELYFAPEYWPDFDDASFDRAMEAFGARERRYGLV